MRVCHLVHISLASTTHKVRHSHGAGIDQSTKKALLTVVDIFPAHWKSDILVCNGKLVTFRRTDILRRHFMRISLQNQHNGTTIKYQSKFFPNKLRVGYGRSWPDLYATSISTYMYVRHDLNWCWWALFGALLACSCISYITWTYVSDQREKSIFSMM